MNLFILLVFAWMVLGVARELAAWPADALSRLFVVGRAVVALLVLLMLLGVMGAGRLS